MERSLHGKLAAPPASLLFVCRRRRLRFVGKHSRVAGRLSDREGERQKGRGEESEKSRGAHGV